MKLTLEELRKVYVEAAGAFEAANLGASGIDAGLLAVARFVAERQRAVEPTARMCFAGGDAIAAAGCSGSEIDHRAEALAAYRAMSAVAPLVVPEE